MAASDHAQPTSRREDALAVARRLADAGHVAYFAGGCVRDQILGLAPKDFDVATSAPPNVVMDLFPRSQGVGQAFGVVLVRFGKSQIEVATFRADGNYSDGRRPDEVRFAGPEEDAQRRDFTINGLFLDLFAEKVIDLVGGVVDLEARLLRAIGDPAHRFAEDYLRLLRAIRFAARFDLTIEPATAAAIRLNADRLPRIAPERIADELRAMLTSPSRDAAVRLLGEFGLTPILLRHVVPAGTTFQSPPALFLAACGGERPSFALALATLSVETLLSAGRSIEDVLQADSVSLIANALRQTFRLSNDDFVSVAAILDVGGLLQSPLPRVSVLKRFLARSDSGDARRLLRGFAAIGIRGDSVRALEEAFIEFPTDTIAPPPFVTGNDLLKMNLAPGPRFKLILDAVYDAQLEGRVTTVEAALEFARNL